MGSADTQAGNRADSQRAILGAADRSSHRHATKRKLANPAKPSVLRAVVATVGCHGICFVAFFDGNTNSTIAPLFRLTLRPLNRLEIWQPLRTDRFAVAMRRLPSVVARAVSTHSGSYPHDLK